MIEEQSEQELYRVQGKVSKSIYDRVMRIKDESGQTINSIVHQMVVYALPHFESLYFPPNQNPKDVALQMLKEPSIFQMLGTIFGDEPKGKLKDDLDIFAEEIKAKNTLNT